MNRKPHSLSLAVFLRMAAANHYADGAPGNVDADDDFDELIPSGFGGGVGGAAEEGLDEAEDGGCPDATDAA